MSGDKYIAQVAGVLTETHGKQASTGAGDAGRIVSLNDQGQVDVTMMPPGFGGTFIFTQGTPSALWAIAHDLGRYPTVVIVDSTGRVVEGDVRYVDTNNIEISFSFAFSGTAYLT